MPLIILLFWSFSVYADTQDTTAGQKPDQATQRENPASMIPYETGDKPANGPLQVNLTYRF